MHQGSCLCGAVKYHINGELGPIIYCHCKRCRKANGSAFSAVSPVAAADLVFTQGEDVLRSYGTGQGVERVFCSQCGAQIVGKRAAMPQIVRLRIGTLDTPIEGSVSTHIFVDSKAEWHNICDDAPQFSERAL